MAETGHKYLDLEALARISNLQLLAKTVVEGFILGLHRSPFRGFSVEFAEYRQYAPGDEIRHIDWKVFGKSDRYYIKQFEEETNLNCHILLDASASMAYGSGGRTKFQYGCYLAACLAYLMINQRDATGLMTFDKTIQNMLPPRSSQTHLNRMLVTLEETKPGKGTDIATPLHEMAEGITKRGLVVLISDLYDDPDRVLGALQHFAFQGHDLLVFQIADHAELTFPFDSVTEFTDPETNEKLLTMGDSVRTHYLKEMEEFFGRVRRGCADIRAEHKVCDTSMPLEIALAEYLYQRSRRM